MQVADVNQVVADRLHHNCSLFDHRGLILYGFSQLFNQTPVIDTHFQHAIIVWNSRQQLVGLKSIQRRSQSFLLWSGRIRYWTLLIGGGLRGELSLYSCGVIGRIVSVHVVLIFLVRYNDFPSLDVSLPFCVKVLGLADVRLFQFSRGIWRIHFLLYRFIINSIHQKYW